MISQSDIWTVDFENVKGNVNWGSLAPSCPEETKGILMNLFPFGCVKLIDGVLKHFHIATFLEQVRRASHSVPLVSWGDNLGAENASRTFYSGPPEFIENMLQHQLTKLTGLIEEGESNSGASAESLQSAFQLILMVRGSLNPS